MCKIDGWIHYLIAGGSDLASITTSTPTMRELLFRFVLLVSTTVLCSARTISTRGGEYSVKHAIEAPRGWTKHSQPPADHKIVLRIGLPQPNFSELERHLYEVSDPNHHRYGQHLSKEEVEELVAPHPESIASVDEWLASFGIADDDIGRTPAKDWVTLTVPISLAEKMLDTVRFRSSLSWVDSGADICASGIQRVETRPEWRIPRPNDKLQPAHSLACTYRCYPAYDHVWSGQTPKVFCQLPRSRRVRYRGRQ